MFGLAGRLRAPKATSVIRFQHRSVSQEPSFHQLHHKEGVVGRADSRLYALNQLGRKRAFAVY